MTCIYCAGRSQVTAMSLEHIWPQSLGGTYAPAAVFQTHDVCARCNNLCGLFVDGAFLKSWFISFERGISAHAYLDPDQPRPAPFFYMGVSNEFPVTEGDVCERWTGMAGERVYHVHREDQERWSPYAGGDILARRTDPGRVYLSLTSPTAYWSLIALASLCTQFPRAHRRCLTRIEGLPRLPMAMPDDLPTSAEETREVEWIRTRPNNMSRGSLTVQVDFSDRFLAKLALGFGRTILGENVCFSPYGNELRRMLWCRTEEDRATIAVHGTNFWDRQLEHLKPVLSWSGAWTITLLSIDDAYILLLATPGGRFMSIQVSDDSRLWQFADEQHREGVIYLCIPARNMVVGPIPMMDFIGHRVANKPLEQLTELEGMRCEFADLPPKEISGTNR